MIKKADWLGISHDRTAVIMLIFLGVGFVVVVISAIFRIHASDVQIPGRYSAYATANIYRNQWYMLYAFPLFALLLAGVNGFLAVKLHSVNRLMSVGILAFSLIIMAICVVVANAIFNLAPSV